MKLRKKASKISEFPFAIALKRLVVLFGFLGMAQYAQGEIQNLSVTPVEVNHYAEYDFDFELHNANNADLNEGDIVRVEFDEAVLLPEELDPGLIRLDGNKVNDFDRDGNTIDIVSPIAVDRGETFEIRFLEDAEIRNPQDTGNYDLTVTAKPGGDQPTGPDTYNFAIEDEVTTTVSEAAITPDPSVEDRSASYRVQFTTGAGGFLEEGQTITIDFPDATTVPDGSVSGVEINEVSSNAEGDELNSEITVTLPSGMQIGNEENVTVYFSIGSGLENPVAGDYSEETSDNSESLFVSTEVEDTEVQSEFYSIDPIDEISSGSITVTDDTVNAVSQYTVDVSVSEEGELISDINDNIHLKFPPQTIVPATMSPSDVEIQSDSDEFGSNPDEIDVTTVDGDTTQVSMVTPTDVDGLEGVQVRFNESAGIQNPVIEDSYNMAAFTTEDVVAFGDTDTTFIDEQNSSSDYTLAAAESSISEPVVTLSDNGVDANNVTYDISFDTGTNGRIIGGTTISTRFDPDTDISSVGSASVDINNQQAASVQVDGDEVVAELPDGMDIGNETEVTLTISDINNPDEEGEYFLEANTSVEDTYISSDSYDIGNPDRLTVTGVTVTDNLVNVDAEYVIDVDNAAELESNKQDEFVYIDFPEGTKMPESIDETDVAFTGTGDAQVKNVSVSQSSRRVTIEVEDDKVTFDQITLENTAGITNPAVAADGYVLEVSTSQQTASAESPAYSINGHNQAVTAGDVTPDPDVVNETDVFYRVRFTTGSVGRLEGGLDVGSSDVTIKFPSGAVDVPGSIAAGDTELDGTTPAEVNVDGQEVTLTLADGQVIPADESVAVDFESAAGLDNLDPPGDYTVEVQTSSETAFSGETDNLTLKDEADLTFNNVDFSPQEVNASSEYNLTFTPGSDESLSSGETFSFEFPTNTEVPSSINNTRILVNGNELNSDASSSGQTLTITTPVDLESLDEVSVDISNNAEVLNPTLHEQDYTMDVNFDDATATSNEYSFDPATTQVSSANVDVDDPRTQDGGGNDIETNYTITFDTGNHGRLLAEESTIQITFPDDTDVNSISSVDINETTTNSSIDDQTLVVDVPDISIGNNEEVSILARDVTNPTTEDDYTLNVATSVETAEITSDSYNISDAGPLQFADELVTFSLQNDTVNQKVNYNFAVELEVGLEGGQDAITIQYPRYSDIPSDVPDGVLFILTEYDDTDTEQRSENIETGVTYDVNDRTSTITLPASFEANLGYTIEITVQTASEIPNPSEPGNDYQLSVKSSEQTSYASREDFEIFAADEGSSSISNLTVKTDRVEEDEPLEWFWEFTTGDLGALESGESTIFLTYTSDEVIPEDFAADFITVEDEPVNEYVKNNQTLEVTVPENATINENQDVEVNIDQDAGIYIDSGDGTESAEKHANTTDAQLLQEEEEDYTASTSTETSDSDSDQDGDPLPVEMQEFTVSSGPNGFAMIQWETATEKENEGFHIERRFVKNEDEVTEWDRVEFVEGSGTTTQNRDYEYFDDGLSQAGSYEYRLVQQDFNGTTETYGPVEFTFGAPDGYELDNNYPNPFNPVTTIPFEVPEATEVTMEIFNVIGERVKTLVDQQKDPGTYTIEFDGSRLASGTYIVRFQAGGVMETMQITLVK